MYQKSNDIIDTRDLHERFDELEELEEILSTAEEELQDFAVDEEDEDSVDAHDDLHEAVKTAKADFGEEEKAELEELRAIKEAVLDWQHGETLIREDYFTHYAEEYADDTGAIDRNCNWPLNHIDWEAAAEDLKQDFSTVEYQGSTYFYRS